MSYTIHPRLTPGRLAWLRQLAVEGEAHRGRGRVGFDCWQLGWTEWVRADSDPITYAVVGRERLTPEGRRVLLQYELTPEGDREP